MATAAVKTSQNSNLFKFLAKPFVAFGKAMVALADANPRYRQLETLSGMSDTELAAKGLKRENIVRHVFHGSYHV